jgi:polynucleotide 5'-kinase involved in rRNA processing
MEKGKNSNGNTKRPVEGMSTAEMIVRAMDVFSDQDVSEEKRHRMAEVNRRFSLRNLRALCVSAVNHL